MEWKNLSSKLCMYVFIYIYIERERERERQRQRQRQTETETETERERERERTPVKTNFPTSRGHSQGIYQICDLQLLKDV